MNKQNSDKQEQRVLDSHLGDMRAQIDAIDDQLAKLYLQRMELVSQVADIKAKQGIAIMHPGRESEIIDRLTKGLDASQAAQIANLYDYIFELSRKSQS